MLANKSEIFLSYDLLIKKSPIHVFSYLALILS